MSAVLQFHHVDVFAPRPYSGNSLAVFSTAEGLTALQMGRITRELRHFESIFLSPGDHERSYRARVFDLVDELDFAGHPVLGAACVLHRLHGANEAERWVIRLNARTVNVSTERKSPRRYSAVIDQGPAEFLGAPAPSSFAAICSWFSLTEADLDETLAPEVVSTGLRYLVLPVRSIGLERARIVTDLTERLASLGAQFAYLLDARQLEARHWNNDGVLEDVATGSGAGCAAAYLRRHDRIDEGELAILRQGRFVSRPSEIQIRAHGSGAAITSVEVGGDVALVGEGRLDVLPEPQ